MQKVAHIAEIAAGGGFAIIWEPVSPSGRNTWSGPHQTREEAIRAARSQVGYWGEEGQWVIQATDTEANELDERIHGGGVRR